MVYSGSKYRGAEILCMACVFFFCFYGAANIDMDFCPDEAARALLSGYIYKHGTLPTGSEKETIIQGWGFSYALKPYLAAIISAGFMKTAAILHLPGRFMLVMSRMGSVLSVTGLCFFCLKIGNRVFQQRASSILFAVIVCFLPQVIFLGMYQNNDALSLFAVSMEFYFLVKGHQEHWSRTSCIGLAAAVSACLLSYYIVYPWILMGGIFFIVSFVHDSCIEHKAKTIMQRAVLIFLIVLLLAGWFFIRNAMLHQGDFLGMASEKISRANLEEQGAVLYSYKSSFADGKSFWEFFSADNYGWVRLTGKSFIGGFGYMNRFLSAAHYKAYSIFVLVMGVVFGITFLKDKKMFFSKLLAVFLAFAGALVLGVSLFHSYYRDYEPQGRYVISLVLIMGYLFAYVSDHVCVQIFTSGSKVFRMHGAVVITWLFLFLNAWFGTMCGMFHFMSE